jgi:hypothetical protein
MGSLRLITLIRNPSPLHAVTLILLYHVLLVIHNLCTDVLLVDYIFNKVFSSLRTRMFGRGGGEHSPCRTFRHLPPVLSLAPDPPSRVPTSPRTN